MEDDPHGRAQWFLRRRLGPDGTHVPDAILKASQARHRQLREQAARVGLAFRPPGGAGTVNWTPIGPSAVRHGSPTGNPVVSGRITGIAAGPNDRVYAGSANAGVWFSADRGATWTPLYEFFFAQPVPPSGDHADSLSVGAIAVRFGAQRDNDLLLVGTGEPVGGYIGYFGVGIKVSTDGGKSFADALEATNLAGAGIYRIAIDPDGADADPIALAATTKGLYRRPASGNPRELWTGTLTGGAATDVVVARQGGSNTWYAAFNTSDANKVYSSTDARNWSGIGGVNAPAGRISLAVSESSVLYALAYDANGKPLLFRREGSGDFVAVVLPARGSDPDIHDLFGTSGKGQGDYDNVVAVDPSNANQVYLAGATAHVQGGYNLMLFGAVIDVTNPAAPALTNVVWIGRGIHSDAHCLAFETKTGGGHDENVIWLGTDGGPFYSTQTGAPGTFAARNDGLAVTQLTYLAQRLDTDAVVISGCQDNGTVRFRGEPAWYHVAPSDGGGTAIDPNNPRRMMRQETYAILATCADGALSETSWSYLWDNNRFPPTKILNDQQTESHNTSSFTRIRALDMGQGATRAAFGTNRLWVTDDWGTTWKTLPSNTNPLDATGPDKFTIDKLEGSVVDICLASTTSILVATTAFAYRFVFAADKWTPNPPQSMFPTGLTTGASVSSLAAENAATGSFYLGVGGTGTYDRVWYYDGTANWYATRPTSGGIPDVMVNALVVDPANTNIVYAGTDVGVWKGTKANATPPTWSWEVFSSGLPEAAVLDLAIHPQARLLRAATHGLGAWEISLDATSALATDVYLRAHDADSGRRFSWALNVPDPASATGYATVAASPDIRACRASKQIPVATLDFVGFADLDIAARVVDATGSNRIFVQVHNRGAVAARQADVSVLLLLAAADRGVPPLPADFATRIANKDTTTGWLDQTGWKFANTAAPYQSPVADLTARVAQAVAFDVDLSAWQWTKGRVCAAAFVTAASDAITGGDPNLETALASNKYLAIRMLQVAPASDYWRQSGPITPRVGDGLRFAMVPLRDGGLFTGGRPSVSGEAASRYRSLGNAWYTPTEPNYSVWTTASLLPDGRVLLTQGATSTDTAFYDPATDAVADGPKRNYDFQGTVLEAQLADGSVLMAGQSGNPVAELFNPRTEVWEVMPAPIGSSEAASFAFGTLTPLADGRALMLVPDVTHGVFTAVPQIFDPHPPRWTVLTLPNNITLPLGNFGVARLSDNAGTVLITGGNVFSGVFGPTSNVVAYDPSSGASGAWTPKAAMTTARMLHTATLLDDGTVLVAGGEDATTSTTATAERYDAPNDRWLPAPAMNKQRNSHGAAKLSTGEVMIVGGFDGLGGTVADTEIYEPAVT
jgi:Galactose oxidase, central domain